MKLLLIPLIVWLITFLLKLVVDLIKKNRRYMHYGGWPSTHTSISIALSTVMALEFGLGSPYFAISTIFSLIIITDALGLRNIISKQSKVINSTNETQLPGNVGHSWLEVISGALLAVILTYIIYQLF